MRLLVMVEEPVQHRLRTSVHIIKTRKMALLLHLIRLMISPNIWPNFVWHSHCGYPFQTNAKLFSTGDNLANSVNNTSIYVDGDDVFCELLMNNYSLF
jgi:hypothetical protein